MKRIFTDIAAAALIASILLTAAGCGAESSSDVDIDLTRMSATMVYSEVFDMTYKPKEYAGKTIRMNGIFSAAFDEEKQDIRYACIIQDATQCCAQGVEFELAEIPEEYPQGGSYVTVAGVYDSYELNGEPYGIVRDAVFEEE